MIKQENKISKNNQRGEGIVIETVEAVVSWFYLHPDQYSSQEGLYDPGVKIFQIHTPCLKKSN